MSSSTSLLTTCCICLERMKEPIRTLPCLHSSCSSCIDGLIKLGKKPFKCPQCRFPFDAPSAASSTPSSTSTSLEGNHFTSHLLASSSSSSSSSSTAGFGGQDEFDPNHIVCEICEENEAKEFCKDCTQFYCPGCKRGHLKSKATSHHQFVSLDDGLKVKSEGFSSSSSQTRITRCHQHPQQEVNSFCEKCKEACCAECAIDNHATHGVIRLTTISQQFKGDITTLLNKVNKYDSELSQAIKEIPGILEALKKQAKLTEEHVHEVFNKLRFLLDEREAELIGDIEKEVHQKGKELMIQKDDLEFLLKGIRDSVEFSERLVSEGNGVEIAASHKPVIGRFHTLEYEMEKVQPPDGGIEFFGGNENDMEESKKMIKGIGEIVVKGSFSPEKSRVGGNDGVVLLNHKYSFDLVLVYQKGMKLTGSAPIAGIQVKIDGPSKGVKVDIVEQPSEDGKQSVSFVLNQVGDHEISVIFKGKHFQGSPFKLKVVDKPVYRRDYGLVGNQPVVRFGSSGNGDGQFSTPCGVACNLQGEIIVLDTENHRIQVFDKDGKFLFKFGSQGNGNGQFYNPYGVTVDHRNHNQIVVADGANHRIQIFDERGEFIRSFGSKGDGDGQFNVPTGIAVDQTNGNYYFVVDQNNHRVQVFDSNWRFIRKFGSKGNGNGQFKAPWGIGLLSNGNIVVSESYGNRLQIFDSVGNFIRVIPGLNYPSHLFVDSDDNILVADSSNHQIQIFQENGNHVKIIGKEQVKDPSGICMDNRGRIIVCENVRENRISIF